MTDFHDHDDVGRLDGVDDSIVAHSQATCAFETVSQRFAELDGMGTELPINRRTDLSFRRRRETWNVVANDAFQIFDPVRQSQALSRAMRFSFFASRSSATREK